MDEIAGGTDMTWQVVAFWDAPLYRVAAFATVVHGSLSTSSIIGPHCRLEKFSASTPKPDFRQ